MFYTTLKMNDNVKVPPGHKDVLWERCERKCMSMDISNVHPRSHLFTVRVWEEETGAAQTEWRGKVPLLTSGEVRHFCGWAALVPLLPTMLTESPSDAQELYIHLPP